MDSDERMKIIIIILEFVTIMFATVIVFSIPTYLLWNLLVPEIFGGKNISFMQAVGILFLTYLLFGKGMTK